MIILEHFHRVKLSVICQLVFFMAKWTTASKINVTPKGVYLPISKLHSILAVANLLAHNNKCQICYCGQISLQSAAVNCSFSDNLTYYGGNIYFAGEMYRLAIWNGDFCYNNRIKIKKQYGTSSRVHLIWKVAMVAKCYEETIL